MVGWHQSFLLKWQVPFFKVTLWEVGDVWFVFFQNQWLFSLICECEAEGCLTYTTWPVDPPHLCSLSHCCCWQGPPQLYHLQTWCRGFCCAVLCCYKSVAWTTGDWAHIFGGPLFSVWWRWMWYYQPKLFVVSLWESPVANYINQSTKQSLKSFGNTVEMIKVTVSQLVVIFYSTFKTHHIDYSP